MEILLNLTLSMINPDPFQMGLTLLEKLHNSETTNGIARKWQSAYTGVAIISNQRTKSHRDNKGRPEWYDTLVSYAGPGVQPFLLNKESWNMTMEWWLHYVEPFWNMKFPPGEMAT
jgi:hypothetical protein